VTRQQVPNVELARDTARANLLTNGGFEIWQRGNGPFTGTSTRAADMWQINLVGADTLSVSRDTANADASTGACAAVTYTRSTGGTVFSQTGLVEQLNTLKGRTVAFSMRVRCATANAVRLRIYDPVTGATYSAYHTGGGAYETLTHSRVVAATATNLLVDAVFDQSCTAYLDNAMLVVGSQAADYAPLHPSDDLARCLRYYEVIGDSYPYPVLGGYGLTSQNLFTNVPFIAKKPVSPTVTKNGTWSVSNCGQPTVLGPNLLGVVMAVVPTASAMTVAQPNAAGQSISVESNP
jgi:hypothetical protein